MLPPVEWLKLKNEGQLPEGAIITPPDDVYFDGGWTSNEGPEEWVARKTVETYYPEAVLIVSH